ncbi:MAG TPA: Lpg1974 family pore-forming outer membrane protein [Thermoguttaceae bacterium]|nr:Lpg1974 family pore-forming outer membrane protein [Thermoguttaceae bacterium]
MWSGIAYKCAGDCLPTRLLGYASTLGALLVTAILLLSPHVAAFGETAESVLADGGDSVLAAGEAWAENSPAECGDECCLTCDPAMNRGRRCYLFADALFWTVREGAAENWAQVITPQGLLETNISTATLVDAPFDWRTGLRVGVGVERCDGADMTLSYTNFRTSATSQASGEVYSAFMGNFYIDNTDGADYGPHYHYGDIWWDFDFHTIDLEIGRNYAIGTNFELRPFLGLKAAIINQTIRSNWLFPIDTYNPKKKITHLYDFTSATENMDLGFWGIGPSLGATMAMPLSNADRYNLRLFGTPSGAILFGHWTFDEQYHNNTPTSVTINMSSITGAAVMLRGVVGLEWEQYFSRATSTVRVGYEAQCWLNQMQFYSYNMGRLNNVTSLQGGFLEWQIRF